MTNNITIDPKNPPHMTPEVQQALSPQDCLELLKAGNARFVDQSPHAHDHLANVEATANGQYPFAVILSCIDSRIPTEIVFDQSVGDVFNARIAGNFQTCILSYRYAEYRCTVRTGSVDNKLRKHRKT